MTRSRCLGRLPLALCLGLILCPAARAAEVAVVTGGDASALEQLAAKELADYLGKLYSRDTFSVGRELPKQGPAIIVGTSNCALVARYLGDKRPAVAESFVVSHRQQDDRPVGVIAGGDSRGTIHGVYALLEKLGCGFTISGDALPKPRDEAFTFDAWQLADEPLVAERLVFNWHNFLSGCSTWNLPEWKQWIAQSQKMRFSAIMVHAYGNNPMAGFTFKDVAKPVGYLSSTVKGRDWSTMHVNDVRRLAGGEVFSSAAFGADAALVPDDQRVSAAQALMRAVFAEAAAREMGVYFAVDVDTHSANPQELVKLLPESARFQVRDVWVADPSSPKARVWIPDPDTPEGYAFFRAEVQTLLRAYPQITRLVVWFRTDKTPWMSLTVDDMPRKWRQQYAAEIARTPEAEKYWHSAALFGIGKVVRAFDRAIKECGHGKTTVAAGTWDFKFLDAADRFFPAGVPLIGLDYNVLHEKPQLGDAASRAPLRNVGARRPVIPVVWAHHDDGHYIGRPYTPLPELASKLGDAKAAGVGVIHWTTRPLDLYFTSVSKQVWKASKDQPLKDTCGELAERWFGPTNRKVMGAYLEKWITEAPRFARETSDFFIDRKPTEIDDVTAGCGQRIEMLDAAEVNSPTPAQRQRIAYHRGLERFTSNIFVAHGKFLESQAALSHKDYDVAVRVIGACPPEQVIQDYARLSALGDITRGEQGLVVSMNTRWRAHIIALRQQLGIEPVRVKFAVTSHDDLAQARGTFSYFIDEDRRIWDCWGERETGAKVFSLSAEGAVTLSEGMPTEWREIARSGIEFDKPLVLTLRPMATRIGSDKSRPKLRAGDYQLRLLTIDTDSTAAEQRVFEVKVNDQSAKRFDVFKQAGQTMQLVELPCDVVVGDDGVVKLTLTPVRGKAMLCGLILQPK